MDRFELVEKLVKTTGVSYSDAKTALESSDWDLLDAAVWLEKNGKIETTAANYTTDPEQQQQQRAKAEEQNHRQQAEHEATRGTAASQSSTNGGVIHSLLRKVKGILFDNELVICKQSGEIFLELPIWLIVLLLILATWATIGVLVLVFILGFRFRLHGPDLGGELINGILSKIENSASDFIGRAKTQYRNNRNRTQNDRNEDVIDYEDTHREE